MIAHCWQCEESFVAKTAYRRWCSGRCKAAAKRRRNGATLDKVARECPVCGLLFKTVRFHQVYCGKPCAQHVQNQRQIAKRRKTSSPPRVSKELIARRCLAIRQRRSPEVAPWLPLAAVADLDAEGGDT